MNALLLSIVLCQFQHGNITRVNNADTKPAPTCKVKGNECKDAGPDYKPICLTEGSMKGTIICEKVKKK